MESGILVFSAVVVLGFTLICALLSSNAEMEKRARELAQRLGAVFHTGGLFEQPTLTLMVRDNAGRLSFGVGRNEGTTLSVRVPAYKGGSFLMNPPGMFCGVESVRVEGLDADLRSSPPELAYDWIFATPRRAEAIASLRRLMRYGTVSIEIQAGSLEVRVDRLLSDESPLRELLRTGSELIGYMLQPPGESGIVWVEPRALAGRCPVCSTAIAAPVVVCPRCDVPHHEQCWDYLGRCAVYGCQPRGGRRAA